MYTLCICRMGTLSTCLTTPFDPGLSAAMRLRRNFFGFWVGLGYTWIFI